MCNEHKAQICFSKRIREVEFSRTIKDEMTDNDKEISRVNDDLLGY